MLDWTAILRFNDLKIESVVVEDEQINLQTHLTSISAQCPHCHQLSSSIHSRYQRHLRDLPISGQSVRLTTQIRRFRCRNEQCAHQTFAEPLTNIAPAFARRTDRLSHALCQLGLAVSAEGGNRLARQLQIKTSPDTLLRVLRKMVLPDRQAPRVLGVDDWALRRGQVYGTILVDLELQRPIELLKGRSADKLAEWLRQHPEVEIISRDRSTEYIRGASEGAPHAQQVADRWHLLKNLREALERMLSRLRPELEKLPLLPDTAAVPADVRQVPLDSVKPCRQSRKQVSRTRRYERYEAVQQLVAQGISEVQIAHQLGLARATVRQFARTKTFPERATNRLLPSILDPYIPYLQQRIREGCIVGSQLWRELQTQGYTGSRTMVARWLQSQRSTAAPTTPGPYLPALITAATPGKTQVPVSRVPAPRQLVWLLLRSTEELSTEEQSTFAYIRQHPQIDLAYHLTRQFQSMVRLRTAEPLPAWFRACQDSQISDMQTFAASLQREAASIRLALSTPWSNGQVEGQVNRLKLIKRSMYGRANFDLLRLRVLAAPP